MQGAPRDIYGPMTLAAVNRDVLSKHGLAERSKRRVRIKAIGRI
jgi:hypothetical protein